MSDDKSKNGVFVGTLHLMISPARHLITRPLAWLYRARYHEKYKRPKHVFAFDMLLIAIGAALAVSIIYLTVFWKPFDPIQAQLTASPKKPVSGGEIVLNFDVSNYSADPIDDAVVTFKFPPEIKFLRSSLPFMRDKNAVNLGSIDAKSDATERIVGSLSGPVGKNLKATAVFTYKESRTGKTVSKNTAVNIKIASSSVGAVFELPNNILVGQAVAGNIRYFNRGNEPAENIVIIPNWPEGFVLSSSDPAMRSGRWELAKLAPGSEGKIDFSGVVSSSSTNADFGVETGVRVGAEILTEASSVKNVSLTDPGISVNIDGRAAARLGDTVTVTATYKNTGSHTLTNAALKLILDDGLTIVSDEQANQLELTPNATGTMSYDLRVADKLPTTLKDAADPQFKVRVSLNGMLDGKENTSIVSPAFAIKIPSTLGLMSVARYWSESGDQLGRGALPPTIGKATRYWIFWNVKNTTGSVNAVRVSGLLPNNVSFTGKVSAPFGDAPIYDPATRTITWNAGDVPVWPGVSSPAIGTAYEVALIPTPDQVDTYPALIKNQTIVGTDAATGFSLSGSASDITAHLTSDPQAADTGKVK